MSATRQIFAHVGGMARALIRHYPINWTFHWNGILRAISSTEGIPAVKQYESMPR